MRKIALLLLIVSLSAFAAAPKKKAKTPAAPATVAPADVGHGMALFLKELSRGGARQVTFRATAAGTRFFFEEKPGVTVYRFDGRKYVKETFLRGSTLAKAVKQYAGRV